MGGSSSTFEATPLIQDPKEGRQSLLVGMVLSVVAWLFGREVVALSFGPVRSPFAGLGDLWVRWDSYNYLAIAQHGRTFYLCSKGSEARLHLPFAWCGVGTWLPGYPAVVSEFHRLGASLATTANAISQLAWLAALFLVWFGWARRLSLPRAAIVMVLCSIFPGVVYCYAIFPVSMTVALLLGALIALQRRHLFLMAILLMCANFCYPASWFATIGLAIGAGILGLQESPREGLRRTAWALSGLLSIPLLMLHDQIVFGHYDAFFILQAQGTDPHVYLPGIPESLVANAGWRAIHLLLVQAAFALLLVGGAVFVVVVRRLRTQRFDADLVPALMGVFVVAGNMYTSTAGAWSRSILIALPSVLCLRKLPPWLLGILLAAGTVITAVLSQYFFDGRFI